MEKNKKTTTFEMLNKKVEIENLFSWGISMKALVVNRPEGIYVPGKIKRCRSFTLDEVLEQVSVENIAFSGTDGKGAHAAFYISDPEMRDYIFGSKEEPIQLTDERFKDMLAQDSEEDLMREMKKIIVTKSEAREAQLRIDTSNEYQKILYKLPEWKRSIITKYCENIMKR